MTVIKKYKVIVGSLRIRENPSAHSSVRILGTLPRNAEFYSDMQDAQPNREVWARRVDEYGRPSGWLQVSTVTARNLQELPMPVPPAFLPEPSLPPMPEPPGGLGVMSRLDALEGWAKTMGFKKD
jgi:hypothetical protein